MLRNQHAQYSIQIRLYDEIIIQRFCFCSLALLIFLFFAEIFLSFGWSNIGSQITVVIFTNSLRREVYWQKCLAGKNLRTSTFEMMINHFYSVQFTCHIFLGQFLCNSSAFTGIWFFSKFCKITCNMKSHFLRLLSNLSTDRINRNVVNALSFILIHSMHHHLNDIGIESTAKRTIRTVNHKSNALNQLMLYFQFTLNRRSTD